MPDFPKQSMPYTRAPRGRRQVAYHMRWQIRLWSEWESDFDVSTVFFATTPTLPNRPNSTPLEPQLTAWLCGASTLLLPLFTSPTLSGDTRAVRTGMGSEFSTKFAETGDDERAVLCWGLRGAGDGWLGFFCRTVEPGERGLECSEKSFSLGCRTVWSDFGEMCARGEWVNSFFWNSTWSDFEWKLFGGGCTNSILVGDVCPEVGKPYLSVGAMWWSGDTRFCSRTWNLPEGGGAKNGSGV